MRQETADMLLTMVGLISLGAAPLAYLLHRIYRAITKIANVPESEAALKWCDAAADMVVRSVQQWAEKKINGLVAEGPTTGAEKKEAALTAIKKMAELQHVTITDELANHAIEAAVQKNKAQGSLRPPPPAQDREDDDEDARDTTPSLPPVAGPGAVR